MGLKVAYTTPLKALSNQKFQDFSNRFGGDRVGLLTGDIVINRGAPILVMTTEVFRNILYSKDPENNLSSLFMVCLDEFHFMNDPDRGSVWEECIISCPQFIRILALSATMGNVNDIKGWISSIHGPTELIVSDHRPVPLRYLYAMRNNLLPYFRDPNAGPGAINGLRIVDGKFDVGTAINPSILKLEEQALQNAQKRLQKSQKPVNTQSIVAYSLIPTYSGLISELRSLKMLPAIVFIFSRLGCEDSARDVLLREASLLTSEETAYVNEAIKNFVSTHPDIPISKSSVQALRNGIAVHHAGLIPVWKGFIEDLFNANKIKALFATETLAAGVNLPARTTVISAVTKRVRSETVKLKTSQLLQMAGRAGRRGKDIEGTVVILRNKFEDVKASHKILTSSVDGIKSHFKISYGIAVKLLESRSIEDCKSLIERGFGSFILQTRVEKK
jgi:superfamily II RNA helicase